MKMPFVDSPDMQQGMPPFAFSNVEFRSFSIVADLAALQAWCDVYLNLSPDYRFAPLAPVVTLGINYYPEMRSAYPGMGNLGFATQHEYYFMFPVVRWRRTMGTLVYDSMTWAFPFIGVDNSTSALTGREVLGFPKMIGTIGYGDKPSGFQSTVRMPSFEQFGFDEQENLHEILSITTGPASATTAATTFPWNIIGHPTVGGGIDAALLALIDLFDPGWFTVTNLKQFRDGTAPLLACWQGLMVCEYQLQNFSDNRLYSEADIAIAIKPNASLPIATTLGISTPPEVISGSGFTADVWFGNVTTLWSES